MSTQEEIKRRLALVVREVEAIYELIGAAEPEMPPAALQRLADRICLECGKKLKDKNVKRGCHEACYRRQDRAIKANKYTDYDCIVAGTRATKQSGGRPAAATEIERNRE